MRTSRSWWRKLWRRYPRTVGTTARLLRAVWHIEWRGVIDSIFRYIQMASTLAILSFIIRIVDEDYALFIRAFLGTAAGIYLGIPVAHWMNSAFSAKYRNRKNAQLASVALSATTILGISNMTISTTLYLEALIGATVRVDESEVRKRYLQWYIRNRERACVMSGRYQSWKSVEARCFRRRVQPVLPASSAHTSGLNR